MFPALRLGYLIVPPGLVDAFLGTRRFVDYHPSILEQAALADFMTEGHFTRHIRRMRILYAERRAILLDAARDLPLDIYAPEAGMHVVGWLPEGVDDRAVAAYAADQNIEVMPISAFAIEPLQRSGLVLGYAGIDEMAIRERVQRLNIVLASAKPR
jgi:GntR family transcriptional regulator/MocR family aminotransferase